MKEVLKIKLRINNNPILIIVNNYNFIEIDNLLENK